MFKDLKWKTAFKRAAIFTFIWVALIYLTQQIWPQAFKIQGGQQVFILAGYAVLFFFLYAIMFAFSDRRRRQASVMRKKDGKSRGTQSRNGSEEDSESELKGRFNPNTSRRKARRRR